MSREPFIIGPFSKGINHFDDDSAIQDTEAVEALNFDPGLDGSLRSRPPFADLGNPLHLGPFGHPRAVGYFYDEHGLSYLIVGDGASSTWSYHAGAWDLITNTFSVSAVQQFNGQAWLVAPVGSSGNGGYWTPSAGFTPDADMPKGASIISYKSRLWIAEGEGGSHPSRIRYSKVMGQPNFWGSPGFYDVSSGDGQAVVSLVTYFDSMLIFRTQSIWSYQYGTDPATAITGVLVPGIGLANKFSIVAHENYMYFIFDDKAYEFINNKAVHLNVKVPFRTMSPGSAAFSHTVSIFNNRIIFSYYETMYVFSLRTRTWTTWQSDSYGAIGQIIASYEGAESQEALALPSKAVPPATTERRNREPNPLGVNSANVTGYMARNAWTRTFVTTSTNPLEWDTVARFTAGGVATGVTAGVDSYGDLDLASPDGGWASPGIIPGETLSIHRYIRHLNLDGSVGYRIYVRFHDGSDWVGASQPGPATEAVDSGDWARPFWSGQVPPGATEYVVSVRFEQPMDVAADTYIETTGHMTEAGNAPGDTVAGSFPATESHTFEWEGAANASPSAMVTRRLTPILAIRDGHGQDVETYQCVLQTKNYSFDVPGSFKVLFWWGVDTIFRTNILGQVNPVVFNLSSTWGQLNTEGATWQRVRTGTWMHPYLTDTSVSDQVVIDNAGPDRKFVRFLKKLRFRQISFRIAFQVDGTSSTGPVQIFTLSAYMAEKQTVSKKIS